MRSVSQTLETLATTLSVHSFVLAIDPFDPSDEGFLGGTTIGREFWRGLRGGGTPGALAFKEHCRRNYDPQASTARIPPITASAPPKSKKTPASLLKSEVYAAVRAALRFVIPPLIYITAITLTHYFVRKASGVRTAEMRWKNQANLENYGVRLVGWPADVPMQNPSTLSAAQNTQILNALNEGRMHFLPIGSLGDPSPQLEPMNDPDPEETASDMDDYVIYEDLPVSGPSGAGLTESFKLQVRHQTPTGFRIPALTLCLQDTSSGWGGQRGVSGPSPFFVSSERSSAGIRAKMREVP